MRTESYRIRQRPAFTLLELLIAVSIFAIVLAAINTIFYSALKLRNKTSDMLDKSAPVEQALRIIKRDLSSLVPPDGALSGQLQTTPTTNGMVGASGTVFYCANGVVGDTTPFGDIQKVSYALVQGTNRYAGMDLVRLVSRNILSPVQEDPMGQLLMSGVQQLTFTYYNGSQWVDSWDSATQDPKLPAGIKVELQMATDPDAGNTIAPMPIAMIIPILVQARTNQTAQTTQ